MNPEAASAPRRRSPLIPVMAGFVLALPFLGFFSIHPDGAFDLLALILAMTGGIYLGAALHGGSRGRVGFESLVAAVLVILAFLGLAWSPLWIALGFVLHGAWDLAHHTGAVRHGVRRWFPPFCAAWDWAIAAMIVFFS
jgi:multisubunit Na+/H+ antiporter MnhB subunit